MIPASDAALLLDLVAPRCSLCAAPATRYEGRPSNGDPALSYACDGHEKLGVRYSDLPGAGVIRRVTELLEAHDYDVTPCPRISVEE